MQEFSTLEACEIVKMDRQRLNEDISSGAYPCAPESRPRVGRYWDENDLCALRVYTFLVGIYGTEGATAKPRFNKSVAGMYAKAILEALRSGDEEAPRMDFPLAGFNDTGVYRQADDAPAFMTSFGYGSPIATVCFSIEGLRAQVRHRIADRQSVKKKA